MSIKDGIRHDEEPADRQDLLRRLQELERDLGTLQAEALRGTNPEEVREIRQQMLNEEAARLQAQLWAKQHVADQDAGQFELTLTSFAQLSSEPIRYRIPGILLDKGLLLICGAAKIGKTTFIIELIDCLRSGKPFLGIECARIMDQIAYLNLEMPASLLRHYAEKMGLPLDSERILIADLNGRAGQLGLLNETARSHLADQLRKAEVEALIVDPLGALVAAIPDASSNDNDLMRRLLEAIKALAAEANIDLVIVIDHTGHQDQNRARGASSKLDTPDMLWAIEKLGNDARQLTVSGRVDNPGQVLGFQLNKTSNRLVPVKIADVETKAENDLLLAQLQELIDQQPGIYQRGAAKELQVTLPRIQRRWNRVTR